MPAPLFNSHSFHHVRTPTNASKACRVPCQRDTLCGAVLRPTAYLADSVDCLALSSCARIAAPLACLMDVWQVAPAACKRGDPRLLLAGGDDGLRQGHRHTCVHIGSVKLSMVYDQ